MATPSTPKQIKESSIVDLIKAYKEKARCLHSQRLAGMIFSEMIRRLGLETLNGIRIAKFHMDKGEGDDEFNDECDKLVNSYV
jgi:hypothetical protein